MTAAPPPVLPTIPPCAATWPRWRPRPAPRPAHDVAGVDVDVDVDVDENGAIRRDPADDSAFARHLRGVDVVGEADVQAALAEVRLRDTDVSYVAVTPEGRLEDVPATDSGPTDDDVHAAAVSAAVREALIAEAAAFGGGDRWTADEAIRCEAVAP